MPDKELEEIKQMMIGAVGELRKILNHLMQFGNQSGKNISEMVDDIEDRLVARQGKTQDPHNPDDADPITPGFQPKVIAQALDQSISEILKVNETLSLDQKQSIAEGLSKARAGMTQVNERIEKVEQNLEEPPKPTSQRRP